MKTNCNGFLCQQHWRGLLRYLQGRGRKFAPKVKVEVAKSKVELVAMVDCHTL